MAKRKQTLYEVLGVKPGASHHEVGLAYNRLIAARRREDAPPDFKAEARIREAFNVLSDLDKRAAYDESLRVARLKPAFGAKQGIFALVFIAAVAAATGWSLRPEPPPAEGFPADRVREAAKPALGRLHGVEMSGASTRAGLAFAVLEGVMVTSCRGLSPAALLRVELPGREIPVRIAMADEALGLCQLDARDAGSWPLPVSPVPAKTHDRLFAAHLDANGQVIVREGKATRVATESGATIIETNLPVMPGTGGAPLLDAQGRVVGVAHAPPDAPGWYVPIPPAWGEPLKEPSSTPPAPEPEAREPEKPELIDPDLPAMRGNIKVSPERRQRLEKAFRPPPNVPEDL